MTIFKKAIDILGKSRVQICALQAQVQRCRCGLNTGGRPAPGLGPLEI
jgi:hypothetical protein